VIGYVGCTSHCYGDHLYFELTLGGQYTAPMA